VGNRRLIGVALGAACIVVTLTGCSGTAAPMVPDSAVIALGAQAIGFSSGDSTPAPTAGWVSQIACPSGVGDGLNSSLPAGSTAVSVDPKIISGLGADPHLTSNDVATCAFRITSNKLTVVELYFFGMDDGAVAVITEQLQSDGFTGGASTAITGGTRQIFTMGTGAVVVEKVAVGTLSAVILAG